MQGAVRCDRCSRLTCCPARTSTSTCPTTSTGIARLPRGSRTSCFRVGAGGRQRQPDPDIDRMPGSDAPEQEKAVRPIEVGAGPFAGQVVIVRRIAGNAVGVVVGAAPGVLRLPVEPPAEPATQRHL